MKQEERRTVERGALLSGRRRGLLRLLGAFFALDARGLATQLAQVVELGAADFAAAHDFNLRNHGRMDGKDALDADAEAHPAHGERGRKQLAAPGNHDAFEGLDALFFLFLALFDFGFAQADVDAHRVARSELGDVCAQLGLLQLINSQVHVRIPWQTHSGGAGTAETNWKYSRRQGESHKWACRFPLRGPPYRADRSSSRMARSSSERAALSKRSGRLRSVLARAERRRQRRTSS